MHVDFNKVETFFTPVVIIIGAIIVSRILSVLLRRYIRKSSKILKVDPTNYVFLQNAVSMLVFLAAVTFVFYSIPQLHTVGTTLFASAGILAAVIGFASQQAFSNIISGIFIVIYKPFSVGDYIKLLSLNQFGIVEDITLRHTVLKTIENRRIVMPNSVISQEAILNSTSKDERINAHVEVVIAYEANATKALQIMQEEGAKHRDFLDIRTTKQREENVPPVEAKVVALEELGVRCRAYVWTTDPSTAYDMHCDLLLCFKERFDQAGIEIAHAQRMLRK